MLNDALHKLQNGVHHDPFDLLGWQTDDKSRQLIRVMLPHAEYVLLENKWPMQRIEGSDIFTVSIISGMKISRHFTVFWEEKDTGEKYQSMSPYTFDPQIADFDLDLFAAGDHHHVYRVLGAHAKIIDGISGYQFAVWAPSVKRISLIADFNQWDGRCHPMRCRGSSAVWEIFIPDFQAGDSYKFEILNADGHILLKTDPYAQAMALRPDTTSLAFSSSHQWKDEKWLLDRELADWQHEPISIYELHAGSWQRDENNHFLNWRELAKRLIPHLENIGYTHIELLPIAEHPLDESWGYQVSGFYAPTARFGNPDDFRYFVDQCHQHNIGIILDWVPAHFPKDDFALARFNGDALYEHADPRQGEHQDWGTLIFDYSRNEVKNFLVANAVYWFEEFHLDGIRVDAVASMLYLDYSRKEGEWIPNQYGGRENLDAVDFLKEMNSVVHHYFSGVLTIAEESTSWPMVTHAVQVGGLGFSMKWNMGWMNDNLSYIEQDSVYRKYHHDQLTFSQMYAYSERFVLPFSHDEVVHGKSSMINKMPGDQWQRFANLRLLYTWQFASPGKKLTFMGGEFAQSREWSESRSLDWGEANDPMNSGMIMMVADLNQLYRKTAALHQLDFSGDGFQWINCHDTEQSVLSFVRYGFEGEASVVALFNFTPVPRNFYRIGVPAANAYTEIFNSDSEFYGGSNCGNPGTVPVIVEPHMGFEQALELQIPPLGALLLKAI